jgi:two-component system, OmpR family, response regulator MprA
MSLTNMTSPPPRLLVVDDDAIAREGLREFLMEEGFEVVTAADGLDALDAMQSFAPALLITDLDMPRLDGRSLVATVRKISPAMRIVVLSAHPAPDRGSVVEAFRADAYITKPIELCDLLRHVHTLV